MNHYWVMRDGQCWDRLWCLFWRKGRPFLGGFRTFSIKKKNIWRKKNCWTCSGFGWPDLTWPAACVRVAVVDVFFVIIFIIVVVVIVICIFHSSSISPFLPLFPGHFLSSLTRTGKLSAIFFRPPCFSSLPYFPAFPPCRSSLPFLPAFPPCRFTLPFLPAAPPYLSSLRWRPETHFLY